MGRGDYERLTPQAIDELWVWMRVGLCGRNVPLRGRRPRVLLDQQYLAKNPHGSCCHGNTGDRFPAGE